jgi:hypothetical protein
MAKQITSVERRCRLGAVDRTIRRPIRSTILAAIAALATIALVLVTSDNNSAVAAYSVVNGKFETGDLTGWSVDSTTGGNASAVSGYPYTFWNEGGVCGAIGMIYPKEGSYFGLLESGIQQRVENVQLLEIICQ